MRGRRTRLLNGESILSVSIETLYLIARGALHRPEMP